MSEIRLIQHGEPITPEVANRPVQDLAQLVSSLMRQLQTLSDTANNVLENQPLDQEVTVGAPVYFNGATGRYSRARVSTRVDQDQVVCDDSAYVIGVVTRKHGVEVGDICLGGVVTIDLEEGGNQDAQQDYRTLGLKWLSVLDGRLTENPPSLAIPVLYVLEVLADGKAKVCVCINFDRVLSGHRHLRYELQARPSGTWLQGAHSVTDEDLTMEGWLPVSAFSDVEIPVGAKYGYNLRPSSIYQQFPLIAPSTFKVHWGQFTNQYDPLPVIGEVPAELVTVNEDGIWWMSDSYTPWYGNADWTAGVCANPAVPLTQTLIAYYTQVTYNTTDAVVMSLETPAESGLSVTDRNSGAPASRGNLRIDLNLDETRQSEIQGGALVLKHAGSGFKNQRFPGDEEAGPAVRNGFFFGPVVESLELDSMSGEVLSWSESEGKYVEYGSGLETTTYDNKPTGRLLFRLNDTWGNFPLPVQAIHLDQMRDSYIGGMAAISFMPNSLSGFSGNVYVPRFRDRSFENLTTKLQLKFTMVAGAVGTISSGDFTGKFTVIPEIPCGDQAFPMPAALPSVCDPIAAGGALEFDFSVRIDTPQMYFCAAAEPIVVSPGAMVWFSLHHAGGFEGALSVIRMEGYLVVDEEDP